MTHAWYDKTRDATTEVVLDNGIASRIELASIFPLPDCDSVIELNWMKSPPDITLAQRRTSRAVAVRSSDSEPVSAELKELILDILHK